MAAIVVHSEAARRAVVAQHGLDAERVHVIHHGAFTDLAPLAAAAVLPDELAGTPTNRSLSASG